MYVIAVVMYLTANNNRTMHMHVFQATQSIVLSADTVL